MTAAVEQRNGERRFMEKVRLALMLLQILIIPILVYMRNLDLRMEHMAAAFELRATKIEAKVDRAVEKIQEHRSESERFEKMRGLPHHQGIQSCMSCKNTMR